MSQIEDKLITIVGSRGSYYINDTSDYTNLTYKTIKIESDAVIAVLEEDDVTSLVARGVSGETLPKGKLITARGVFSRIQLTSGSITLY